MPFIIDETTKIDGAGYAGLNCANIKVVGVGGGGGNALNCIVEEGVENVEYIALNTDAQALRKSKATKVVQIGSRLTKGLGAGGNPEVGESAAQESKEEIEQLLDGADMVFITAGMGGGTGTGAAPVVAEIANSMGILTVAVVTKPFDFEGQRKKNQAEAGVEKLLKYVDSLIVIPNSKLLTGKERLSMREAFAKSDDILKTAVVSVTKLILTSGDINVDFADVKAIMTKAGYAHMAIGHGEGDNKVQEAVQQVISSPLLETSINGAKRLLLYISMSMDIVTGDITELTDTITKAASPDVNFIFGSGFDENLDNALDVIVIASDFSDDDKPVQAEPQAEPSVASEPGAPAEENKKPAQRNDWWDFLYKNDGANNN